MNRLFVYGIFLDEDMRRSYGMSNPRYATVLDYATYGKGIVTAYRQVGAGLSLTGLLVDVPAKTQWQDANNVWHEDDNWLDLDRLELNYKRIIIKTTDGDEAYMYAGKE